MVNTFGIHKGDACTGEGSPEDGRTANRENYYYPIKPTSFTTQYYTLTSGSSGSPQVAELWEPPYSASI